MQRQSLGSPSSSKLLPLTDSPHQHQTSSSSYPSNGKALSQEQEEELKKLKPMPRTTPSESYIHLIPLLTLLCFLILYLSSHNPTPSDLAEFDGFERLSKSGDSSESIHKLQGFVDIKQGTTLARSWKNRRFLRRKMADF